MLRGRYGLGWMALAWLTIVALIAVAMFLGMLLGRIIPT